MMCAFMTPVLKNDWEIYNTKANKRSRNNSECSAVSAPPSHRSRPPHAKRRGIGETGRSFSYHAPSMHERGHNVISSSPTRAYHMSTKNSRCPSRASMEPHSPGTTSPPVSPLATNSCSGVARNGPTKSPSSGSLLKFQNKVVDKLKAVLHLNKDSHHEDEEQEDTRGQS